MRGGPSMAAATKRPDPHDVDVATSVGSRQVPGMKLVRAVTERQRPRRSNGSTLWSVLVVQKVFDGVSSQVCSLAVVAPLPVARSTIRRPSSRGYMFRAIACRLFANASTTPSSM